MLDALDLNFKPMPHPEFIIFLGTVADRMSNHPVLQSNWPEFVPSPDRLRAEASGLKEAIQAAANGDRQRIAERNAKRVRAEVAAVVVGQYATMRAIHQDDPTMLLDLGFKVKGKVSGKRSASSGALRAPSNATAKHAPVSGTLLVKARREPGAATYELQMCHGDPTGEDSWINLGLFVHCSHIEVKDQQPGSKCTFRIRCHGVNGPGPWSANFSQIVI